MMALDVKVNRLQLHFMSPPNCVIIQKIVLKAQHQNCQPHGGTRRGDHRESLKPVGITLRGH